MTASSPETVTQRLQQRRKSLGMTYVTVARLSGIAPATVERALSARPYKVSLEDTLAMATAMGINLALEEETDTATILHQQAESKARELVNLVQGTSLLEAQAIGTDQHQRMIDATTRELLSKSRRRLWDTT